MRVWRALLWKESREELPKVLVALRQNADFNEEFADEFGRWIANFIVVCGVALGMNLVAKESSKGTLAFLLGKPLSAVEVLLPKYAVGAVVLFAAAAGAWATVYLDLEGLASGRYVFYNSRLIAMDGDELYVERFWPHELVEFDISDPDSLREVGLLSPSDRWGLEQLLIANGVAYGLIGHSDVQVRAWTIAGYGALVEGDPLIVPEDPDSDHSWGFNAMSVANGYLYATRRGALLAYRLD